ncbi:hypothetical protein ES705_07087 [subsurface metagenome]
MGDPKSLKTERRSCKDLFHKRIKDKKEGRMAHSHEKKVNSPKFIKCHKPPVVEY